MYMYPIYVLTMGLVSQPSPLASSRLSKARDNSWAMDMRRSLTEDGCGFRPGERRFFVGIHNLDMDVESWIWDVDLDRSNCFVVICVCAEIGEYASFGTYNEEDVDEPWGFVSPRCHRCQGRNNDHCPIGLPQYP